jgi:hypothetical protein
MLSPSLACKIPPCNERVYEVERKRLNAVVACGFDARDGGRASGVAVLVKMIQRFIGCSCHSSRLNPVVDLPLCMAIYIRLIGAWLEGLRA